MKQKSRRWFPLDNAAKIFPASMRRGWSNVFRLSVSFRKKVDPDALSRALDRLAKRFPTVSVRLGRGFFWYFLEESAHVPHPTEEGCQPLLPMSKKEMRQLALRVLYYENRIAVEFFHAITDGGGGMVFLKTLAATYLEEAEGIPVIPEKGILSPDEEPNPEEWEDAFLTHAGGVPEKRDTSPAYALLGEKEEDGFLHVTCGTVSVSAILSLAREKGVSVTTLLAALLTLSLTRIQNRQVPPKKRRAVRIQIPVDLRRHFPTKSLRNFVAVVNVGLEKGEEDAELDEILSRIHHQMALYTTPRNLRAVFTANVNSEKGMTIRLVPRALKNLVMRAVFDRVGESRACLCLSNLGAVRFPDSVESEVTRMDFIIGPQAKAPYNCGVVSCGDDLRINLVRNTKEPVLEKEFFPLLSSLGLSVSLESNER